MFDNELLHLNQLLEKEVDHLEEQNKQLLDALVKIYNYNKCNHCKSECPFFKTCVLKETKELIISITGKKPEEL
jgi:hypothetical protein